MANHLKKSLYTSGWRGVALAGLLGLQSAVQASVPAGISEFIIPFDEDVLASVTDPLTSANVDTPPLYPASAYSNNYSIITVTIWADNTTLYYDHWENGYGLDATNPVATADERYEGLTRGQVLSFTSPSVPRPRTLSNGNTYRGAAADCTTQPAPVTPTARVTPDFCYDGRDRVLVVGATATVTRSGWPLNPGVVAAAAEEVYPLSPQLTKYILPFGEVAGDNDFEGIYVVIQATEDNTAVQIDFNGDGTFDNFNTENGLSHGTAKADPTDASAITLQRGQTYILDRDSDGVGGMLQKGVVILGSKTLQVQYFYGDRNSSHNTRSVSAYPRGFWDDEYYAPVSTEAGDSTDVLLHNPHNFVITINYELRSSSGSFTLAANETAFFQAKTGTFIPHGSAAYFKGSNLFWGTSDIDKNGATYDWGYSLVPAYLLEQEQFLGWAPGSEPDHGTVDLNANGIFITPVQDNTLIFIDKAPANGVPDTTLSVTVGGVGRAPTSSGYLADRLESLYITSTTAGNAGRNAGLSGARIWATGPYVLAYGENPSTAPGSDPGMDLGYTTLPSPENWMDLALTVDKTTNPVVLSTTANPAVTTYTLVLRSHEFDLNTVRALDTLAADWTYAIGTDSTTITFPNGSMLTGAGANPTVTAPGVALPAEFGGTCPASGGSCLTWGTGVLGTMGQDQQLSIQFTARTIGTPSYVAGALSINQVDAVATRDVGGITQVFNASDFAFNTYLDGNVSMAVTKSSSVPEATPVSPGDTYTYTTTVSNPGTTTLTGISIYDPLPAGINYVSGSGSVSCILPTTTSNVRDEFASVAYSNNNGSQSWVGDWSETDSQGGGPTSGLVSVSGGQLRLGPFVATTTFATATDNFASGGYTGGSGWATNWVETGDDGTSGGDVGIDGDDRIEFRENTNADDAVTRTVTVTSATSIAVSYFFLRNNSLDADDDLLIEYSVDGAAWTLLRTVDGSTPDNTTFNEPAIAWNPTDTTFHFRFRAEDAIENGEEGRFDNVTIVATDTVIVPSTGAGLQRTVNLSGGVDSANLTFTPAAANLEAGDTLVIEASSSAGGPFTTLATYTAGTPDNAQPYNLLPYAAATTTIRFRVTGGYDVADETFAIDDVNVAYTMPPVLMSFAANAPPNFLNSATNCLINAGGSLTLTFNVTVDDPFPTGVSEILNTAYVQANEIPIPLSDDARNIVNVPSSDTATVGDRVWFDTNGDGILDVGEAGIPNVEVTLKDQFGTPLQTATTDSLGRYQFSGIPPGTGYYVEVTGGLPNGLSQTNGTSNRTVAFNLVAGQTYDNADLGYRPSANTALIGDRVWSDADGDGVQDAGEPGLGGIAVRLYPDTDGDGTIDDTSAVDLLSGLLDIDGDGSITSVDDGGVVDNGGTTRGVINGLLDFTNDGVINASDSGSVNLGGTSYTLTNGVLSGGMDPTPAIANFRSVVTEPDGSYLFNVAATGAQDYIAAIVGNQPALTGYHVTTAGQYSLQNVANGVSYLTADFGVQQDAAGSTYGIQDRIWRDTNGDGDQDVGEPGIAGVTVDLLDASSNVIATTMTDSTGLFSFAGVPEGVRYSWRITDTGGVLNNYFGTTPEALARVFQMPNTLDEADDMADGTNNDVVDYSSPAGPVGYRPHFGFNLTRSIGDTVFNDLGGTNGVQDVGEPGISGVTVKLYNDVNGNGIIDAGVDLVQATVMTNSSGNYLFSGLADGNYIVSIESPPAGYTYTGIAPMLDSDGVTAGQQNAASIVAGVSDLTNDFAYRASGTPRTLAGVIWDDNGISGGAAGDGVQNGSEPGIVGVTLDLYQDTDGDGMIDPGEPVIGTTTTVVGGGYSFTGLPGTGTQDYIVRVTDTNGVLSGYDTTFERTELMTAPFNGRESVLNLNGDVTNINFGYNSPAAATYASVTNFSASADPADGRVLVQWETLLESGTAGFYLERRDAATGQYLRLHNPILTAVLYSPLGGYYAFADNGAKAGETHSYRLIEIEVDGDVLTHGPYTVTLKSTNPVVAASDAGPVANGISISALAADAKREGYARQVKPLGTVRTRADGASIDPPTSINTPTPTTGLFAITQVKLPVTHGGLSYVSAADLAESLGTSTAGMAQILAAGRLALTMGGNAVAYTVAAANTGIYFVGEAYANRYTDQNLYFATINQTGAAMTHATGTAPTAVATVQSYFDTLAAEENRWLIPYAPLNAAADVWYWGYVNVGGTSPSGPYTLAVNAPGATSSGTARLTLWLQGASNLALGVDHHAVIWVNGTQVGETLWDGQNAQQVQVSFNQSLLQTAGNQIQVSGIQEAGVTLSSFLIDKLELGYNRQYSAVNDSLTLRGDGNSVVTVAGFTGADIAVFELANPNQPVLIDAVTITQIGGNYSASFVPRGASVDYLVVRLTAAVQPQRVTEFGSDLKASNNGADYLIIAPASLQPGADALAAYRSARFQTQVVTLEDIYDEFNAGRADAAAIRAFLSQVAQSWSRRPQYVVLLGKGTLDPRNYQGLGTNRLPVLLAATPDGLYQADGQYADVQGNDGVPEFALGRIPALDNAEVLAYVAKLTAFEATGAQALKALLVADNADSAGNFPQDSTALAGLLGGIALTQVTHDASIPAATTRQNVLNGLNAGTAVWNYLGHGAPTQLADEGLLRSSDVASLNNSRLPIFGAFSCYLGYDAIPGLDSLVNDLTLKASGGVIATLAPTGLSRNDYAVALDAAFTPALSAGQTVGLATNAALSAVQQQGVPRYMRDIYSVVGDPAVSAR